MPISLEEFLNNASLPEMQVQILPDPTLVFTRNKLAEAIEEQPATNRRAASGRGEIMKQLEAIDQQIKDTAVEFRLRALSPEWLDENRELATKAASDETQDVHFQLAMILESLQEPKVDSLDDAKRLRNAIGVPQWKLLMDAIAKLTWEEHPIPFARKI